ncbi:MAG: ATP-binding protein [Armatimonas sp.]
MEQQRRFTADASHELKSPLTVIKGTTGMALESQLPFTEEQYRQCASSRSAVSRTPWWGGAGLDFLPARSDSWQLGQNQIEVLLSEVLESAIKITPSHGAPIRLELSDPALIIQGNEGELIRLFTNLLDNARRHTPEPGEVRVSAETVGDDIVLHIQDNGEGIAPEHLPHLGERFYRVDSARARSGKSSGSGLGLSICKAITAAHNGTLEIESKIGEGTTVTVCLPKPPAEADS